jgi:hypothetical protein
LSLLEEMLSDACALLSPPALPYRTMSSLPAQISSTHVGRICGVQSTH